MKDSGIIYIDRGEDKTIYCNDHECVRSWCPKHRDKAKRHDHTVMWGSNTNCYIKITELDMNDHEYPD